MKTSTQSEMRTYSAYNFAERDALFRRGRKLRAEAFANAFATLARAFRRDARQASDSSFAAPFNSAASTERQPDGIPGRYAGQEPNARDSARHVA